MVKFADYECKKCGMIVEEIFLSDMTPIPTTNEAVCAKCKCNLTKALHQRRNAEGRILEATKESDNAE